MANKGVTQPIRAELGTAEFIVTGLVVGLLIAAFSGAVYFAAAVSGASIGDIVDALSVMAVDSAGGLLGGIIAAALQKLLTSLVGSAVVGWLSVLPWFTGIWLLMGGGMTRFDVAGLVVSSVLIGGGLGAYYGQHLGSVRSSA